ncbi:terpenoid synthase [Ramaria rubella]|nr:terpenoid synthase [Ramaria rubella]
MSEIILPAYLYLPDFLASWPYERRLNHHCLEVNKAAYAWISTYGLLKPKSQRAFESCNSGLLAALAYPDVGKDHLRIVCDALNIVFLFDDYSDLQEPHIVREIADNIINALCHPNTPPNPRVKDHARFGEITRDFWSRALQILSPSCAHRFIESFCTYATSIVQQAKDRSREHVRDVESYLALRRDTIGAKLAFALIDSVDEIDPLDDPMVVELENAAIDIISLTNDAYSFDVEQSRNDHAHNMLTCIMLSQNLPLQEAMIVLETHVSRIKKQFLDTKACIEAIHGNTSRSLSAYIDGIGTWVRANDTWSFESQRYFGLQGLEIQAQRVVALRPKRSPL